MLLKQAVHAHRRQSPEEGFFETYPRYGRRHGRNFKHRLSQPFTHLIHYLIGLMNSQNGRQTEERLAKIWSTVLRIEPIGVHDNFFVLGGHSLMAMQVMARLRETWPVEIPIRVLFETPTIAALAEQVISEQHLDAKPANGKMGGAFCYSVHPKR